MPILEESKSSRRGVSLVVFLCFGQNFVGTFAVSMYAQMIFDKAGTKLSPEICSVIYGIVVISGTALALVLMDIAGRKVSKLLIQCQDVASVTMALAPSTPVTHREGPGII